MSLGHNNKKNNNITLNPDDNTFIDTIVNQPFVSFDLEWSMEKDEYDEYPIIQLDSSIMEASSTHYYSKITRGNQKNLFYTRS